MVSIFKMAFLKKNCPLSSIFSEMLQKKPFLVIFGQNALLSLILQLLNHFLLEKRDI